MLQELPVCLLHTYITETCAQDNHAYMVPWYMIWLVLHLYITMNCAQSNQANIIVIQDICLLHTCITYNGTQSNQTYMV
jgi:hypothetical protein